MLIKKLQSELDIKTREDKTLHSILETQKESMKNLETEVTKLSTVLSSLTLTNQTASISKSVPSPDVSQLEDRIKEVETNNYILLHSIDDLEKGVKVLQMKMSRLTSCYECDLCEKTFPSDSILKNHLWLDHGQRTLFGP